MPWCQLYNMANIHDNHDKVLRNLSSPTHEGEITYDSKEYRPQGSLRERNEISYEYDLSVELQVHYGQVYYLIKLARRMKSSLDDEETNTDARSTKANGKAIRVQP